MISREIQCTYCGWKGMTGRSNQKTHDPDEQTFNYLGHNFLSGHLHYQCPACSMVLLVPPTDILRGNFPRGIPHASSPKNEVFIEGKVWTDCMPLSDFGTLDLRSPFP